ncbi:hypothetical protein [Robertkochia flava]|uniref:hypothetical protein n=1 Tax=Robertkochia flava TaxID=3447986 RepID=UPI001CCF16E6|nr:hypothetical protein [Robertkochia marina]
MRTYLVLLFTCSLFWSCNTDDTETTSEPTLVVKMQFSDTQERLNNLGQPAGIPAGNAAQTPVVNGMSAHYIELTPDALTPLGEGQIIYMGEETNAGGEKAIDFEKARVVAHNENFMEIPLSGLAPGTYTWVRVSISYQNGTIDFLNNGALLQGTIASFLGYNNYISSVDINGEVVAVNENKLQGFWIFETLGQTFSGQAPEGAVTVPNPLFETSPIPQGSCVVTGAFTEPLVITGNESKNITINLSFSVNNSFEWQEVNADGKYEPAAGEQLADMGLRGLVPTHQ